MSYPVAACRGMKATAAAGSSNPSTLAGLQLWLRGLSGVMRQAADGTGSEPSSSDPIGRWVQPGDSLTSPSNRYATESTNKPTVTISSGTYTVNAASGKYLTISSSISLTGDFVLWAVIKTDRSARMYVSGSGSTNSEISIDVTGRIQCAVDAATSVSSSAGAIATSTRALVRIRRASGTLYIAASGYSETSGSLTGTATINRLLFAAGSTSTVVADIGEIIISTDTTTATSPPASIDGASGWFKTGQYGSEPAWGLQI